MFGIGRKKDLEPVTFMPVRRVFEAQVQIRMNQDVSGWVGGNKKHRKKYALSKGQVYTIDAKTAREFVAKEYATWVRPQDHQPISDDERAEAKSQITTLSLGA